MKVAITSDRGAGVKVHLALRLPLLALILSGTSHALFAQQQVVDSTEPFFAVASRQTYSPSQQPRVTIDFRQVDHLDFRVYRVKDPIQFFSKLRDAHSFGSEKQELAREKTWLEEFHDWKRDLRLSIRNFFRRQLRYETRHAHHELQVRERERVRRIPLDITAYAQVPLLNREQLAVAWREMLPKTRGSEHEEIPIDLHQKGLFLVEVAHGDLRAYTLLIITDLAMVSKNSRGQILLFVADRNSGAPVPGATTVIFNNHQEAARGTTDASGVYAMTFDKIKIQDAIMVSQSANDVAATSLESFWFGDASATNLVGYVYTDRPVYRPTHQVQFKGIVRKRLAGQFRLDNSQRVTVEIADSNQKTVYQEKLDVSPFG